MHQRTFLIVAAVAAGLLLWSLLPFVAPRPGGGGVRFGSLYVFWLPDQMPATAHAVDGLWLTRQADGGFSVFLNQDPFGGPLLWEQSAVAFQAQLSHGSYGMDGRCEGEACAGDLCRVRAASRGRDLLIVWSRRYLSGICPAGAGLNAR